MKNQGMQASRLLGVTFHQIVKPVTLHEKSKGDMSPLSTLLLSRKNVRQISRLNLERANAGE
jgi:hypothetical protein